MSEPTGTKSRVVARAWILRRPGFFNAWETWYVQRGGKYSTCNYEARSNAHEYTTLRAARRAQCEVFQNFQVWRRGRRAK